MSRPTTVEFNQPRSRAALRLELIRASVRSRWGNGDWEEIFPWWRRPAQVRILIYADGLMQFVGGTFGGLTYVKALLESRAYFNVDFTVATAHRTGGDTGATIEGPRQLTDPELDILCNFDEIWFFGYNSVPNLTSEELDLLDRFMAAPKCGGVLATGDHACLGKGIAGQIKRAGEMRKYPAPENQPPLWNTTLEEGPDSNNTFDEFDQSDDLPQTIRYERFHVWSPPGFKRRSRPHPVLCGPDGPIDVFPDHQHEGEALAPTPTACDKNWPTENGYQEQPFVIAWGMIKDPDATNHGKEFGLVSAYNGHNVNVGRIVADSTWHHWVDVNLTGVNGVEPTSPYNGFDATPAGRAVLRKIDAYFLNCATWLAPPDKQAEMRRAAWWSILWTGQIAELSPDAPLWHLGAEALEALGQRASSCAVTDWVLDIPAFREQISNQQLTQFFEHFEFINLPFEQYVAGGIIKELMLTVGPSNPKLRFPSAPPSDGALEAAINEGVVKGMSELTEKLSKEAKRLSAMVANKFRLE